MNCSPTSEKEEAEVRRPKIEDRRPKIEDRNLETPDLLEWDNFYQSPTYQPKRKMVVQHTPQKTTDESFPWKLTIEGQEKVIYVNTDQNDYLTLDTTTPEQQNEFLKRIFEDQQKKQEAAAGSTAARINPEDLDLSRNSPTTTDQSLEDIRERTNIIEESLPKNTEVKKLVDEGEHGHEACRNRHHEFEARTKTHLAVPAKRYIKAVNTLMVQLDRSKYADEVSKQYGDELLNDVQDLYLKLEEAREYCLEPLNEDERLQYEEYLQIKFELKCTCERVHRQYFEQVEQNKKLRNQQQMMTPPQQPQGQVQPPNNMMYHPPPITTNAHCCNVVLKTLLSRIWYIMNFFFI